MKVKSCLVHYGPHLPEYGLVGYVRVWDALVEDVPDFHGRVMVEGVVRRTWRRVARTRKPENFIIGILATFGLIDLNEYEDVLDEVPYKTIVRPDAVTEIVLA